MLIILQKKSGKSWSKANEMEVNKLNTHLTNHSVTSLTTLTLRTTVLENELLKQSKAAPVRFVKTNSCVNIVRQHFP